MEPAPAADGGNHFCSKPMAQSLEWRQYVPPSAEPFRHRYEKYGTVLQVLKMVLVGIVLFPIRLVFSVSSIMLALALAKLRMALFGQAIDTERGIFYPLAGAAILIAIRLCARVFMFAMGYWWIKVEDRRSAEQRKRLADGTMARPPIIVANHSTFLDPFYFIYAEGAMAVAKSAILDFPVIGTVAKALQTIPVTRENSANRTAVRDELSRRARWTFDQPSDTINAYPPWPPLVVFPESTCTNTEAVIHFKVGAFTPHVPVQPVSLDFRQDHLDTSWLNNSLALNMLCMMCQVYNSLQVVYLPIDDPDEYPADTPLNAAERCRTAIADALAVPKTDHSFLDVLLQLESMALALPEETANVELSNPAATAALERATTVQGSPLDRAKDCLHRFAALDSDNDGFLDAADLAALLGVPLDTAAEPLVAAVLAHFDLDHDGKIGFSEFLLFAACVRASRSAEPHPRTPRTLGTFVNPTGDVASTIASCSGSNTPFGDQTTDDDATTAVPLDPEMSAAFDLAFAAMDTDGDGVVSVADLARLCGATQNSGLELSQVEQLFKAVSSTSDPTPFPTPRVEPSAQGGGTFTHGQFQRFCTQFPLLVVAFLDAVGATLALERHRSDASVESAVQPC